MKMGRALVLLAAVGIVGASGSTGQLSSQELAQAPPGLKRKVQRTPTAYDSGEGGTVAKVNNWTVGLAGGLPEGTFLRFAAEIARNVNDPENLRVLPVVTQGATDNVKDLLYLRGIDIAITNADVLEHFKTIEKTPNIEKRINYISELVISEVHLVVRPEINSIKDLEGKKVSLGSKGAGQSTTGPIVFQKLGVKPEFVYINNAIALEQMKTGEIAGIVNNGAKPQDIFTKFKNEGSNFKFLPIPIDRFDEYYVPSVLTSDDYPGFIKPGEKVETLAVQTVLAVYNWPNNNDRFRRVQRFIEHYFQKFETLRKPPYHPKWKSVNLAANVPGWTRYFAAEEMLKQMTASSAPAQQPGQTQGGRQAVRSASDAAEQERLFQQFLEWSRKQGK